MKEHSALIEKWLTAWSLSRKLSLPVKYRSGFKVEVGYEKQLRRYVFPELNEDLIHLAQVIREPRIFLKVCASPAEVKKVVPANWEIEPRYMMSCHGLMKNQNLRLNKAYKLELETEESTCVMRIVTQAGEAASEGRLVIVDDLAVYDRIFTEPGHRRKGLASVLMKELEKVAVAKGIAHKFLVATEEGKGLYASLGWTLYSSYTTLVIPG